jgi:hypothetical protein
MSENGGRRAIFALILTRRRWFSDARGIVGASCDYAKAKAFEACLANSKNFTC